jgi:hypothetical protein
MDGVKLQARIGQPLGEPVYRLRVVIIEVRPRGEQLDRFEAVRRDMHEVLARQPRFVKEVG